MSDWRFWAAPDGDRSAPALYEARDDRWWRYGELMDAVGEVARRLAGPPRVAFLHCRSDVPTIVGLCALLDAGHAVALIDARLDRELLAGLEAAYRPDLVLGRGPPDGAGPALEERAGGGPDPHPALGLLLSTSGTTGSPKFARLTRENLGANAASIVTALGITAEDCGVTSLPIHYSYGLSLLTTHLRAGARLIVTEPALMAEAFWADVRRGGCTSFAGVPYSYQMLRRLDLDALDVPTLRTMTQAGGRLADELILEFHRRMAQRGGHFFVMYGQTEATARISVLPPERLPDAVGSVGYAIPGGRLAVRADGTDTTEPDRSGEIVYEGPNVMLGYAHGREDLARGDEQQGRLRTGDLGQFDADGLLYVTGRSTRVAKVFGLRVNLDEIEAVVRRRGAAAAVGAGERLVIFCEYGDDGSFRDEATELARRFRVNHRAFEFRRVDRLPVTSSGKIDYRALQEAV